MKYLQYFCRGGGWEANKTKKPALQAGCGFMSGDAVLRVVPPAGIRTFLKSTAYSGVA
jgi:hypothetical protein